METVIGTLGATIILISFLLVQTKVWNPDTLLYDILNFLGSVFLVIYAVLLKSYPFLILNSIWGLFSLKDVIFHFIKKEN